MVLRDCAEKELRSQFLEQSEGLPVDTGVRYSGARATLRSGREHRHQYLQGRVGCRQRCLSGQPAVGVSRGRLPLEHRRGHDQARSPAGVQPALSHGCFGRWHRHRRRQSRLCGRPPLHRGLPPDGRRGAGGADTEREQRERAREFGRECGCPALTHGALIFAGPALHFDN